jgi:hypothetical protein
MELEVSKKPHHLVLLSNQTPHRSEAQNRNGFYFLNAFLHAEAWSCVGLKSVSKSHPVFD